MPVQPKPITTDRQVAAFTPDEGQHKARNAVANRSIGGLCIEARADRRTKPWLYRFRLGGKQIEMTLGAYPLMSLAEARQAHADAAKLVEKGIDPRKHRAAEKARNVAAWTMQEAFDQWIASYAQANTKRGHPPTLKTVAQHKARWRLHLAPRLADMYVRDVSRRLLIEVLADAATNAKEEARKGLNLIRLLLEYCEDLEQVDDNPAAGLTPSKVKARPSQPRQRHLSLPELLELWATLDESHHQPKGLASTAVLNATTANAIRFLILTGMRRSEVAGMRWQEVRRDTWIIPKERTKNRKAAHRVWLAPLAQEILTKQRPYATGPYVFPSLNEPERHLHEDSITTAIARLQGRSRKEHDETAPLYHFEHFTVHDLRRSAATLWSEVLQADLLLVEQMLSHSLPKLMATYNHAQRWALQVHVWQRWAKLIQRSLEDDESSNVVPLSASRLG